MVSADRVHFLSPTSVHWSVHEIQDPSTATGRSLIFVSDDGFRRVRDYPANWRHLDDAALWALSWGT